MLKLKNAVNSYVMTKKKFNRKKKTKRRMKGGANASGSVNKVVNPAPEGLIKTQEGEPSLGPSGTGALVPSEPAASGPLKELKNAAVKNSNEKNLQVNSLTNLPKGGKNSALVSNGIGAHFSAQINGKSPNGATVVKVKEALSGGSRKKKKSLKGGRRRR